MRRVEAPPPTSLEGQFLIAMPSLQEGPFARSVVYMCAHRDDGAMGIVINQRAEEIDFGKLLVQLDIVPETEAIRLPPRAEAVRVLRGGPVETGRGFVLHSNDYGVNDSTVKIGEHVCLTATLDILRAIARGTGPARAVLALGYAGWASGSSRARSSPTAGSPARPIPASSSTPISTANMIGRSRSSASTRACSPP